MEIKINIPAIKNDIESAAEKAVYETSNQILNTINTKYLPRTGGSLLEHGNITSDLDKGILRWDMPYARFLYYGVVMVDDITRSVYSPENGNKITTSKQLEFNKELNPKAGSFWVERAEADHGEAWRKTFEKTFREGL